MTKNVFGKDLHLKQIFFFFLKLMLERGLFPVVWKMKSPSKICLPGDEGLAVNIFNYPPERLHALFWGCVEVSKTGSGRIRVVFYILQEPHWGQ